MTSTLAQCSCSTAKALKAAAASAPRQNFQYAGLYALRMAISRQRPITRVGEHLYGKVELDARKSDQKQFDYVDPKNRAVQIEMEDAATEHLKQIGAWLKPRFKAPNLDGAAFQTEASVIIPVKNRVKTVGDAVNSVLKQQDHLPLQPDRRGQPLDGRHDRPAALLRPERQPDDPSHSGSGRTLLIGGCWNEAIMHPACGRFAVQLDSDDIYKDETTLQKIVDAFHREKCAAVIGSYRMTNFKLEEIPPGVIDHREWTPENGRNNALRIQASARRAPTTRRSSGASGSPMSVMARITPRCWRSPANTRSRRIYEPIYLCRRWEGNSDAGIDVAKQNAFNLYKDKLRTFEIHRPAADEQGPEGERPGREEECGAESAKARKRRR